MKKKIFLMLVVMAMLVCALAISVGAKTIISENNLDENGDIVADFKYLVNTGYYYCTVDITYNDTNGNQKEGQFVYYTGGLYVGRLQLLGVYIPQDFDFSQTVYLFDKVDANGDGSFGSDEYLKGSNGGTNAMHWHSYESFDGATGKFSQETTNVKPFITTLSYSKYMTYFGHYFMPCADSLTTVTYNGREPVEGTVFISPTVTEIMSNTFGGEGDNSKNREEANYTRLVFEERTGSLIMQQYAFCRVVLKEIVFLDGTYSFRNDSIAFVWEKGTNNPCLEKIVVTPGAVLKSNPISWNVGNYDIVYIGTEGEYTEQTANGNLTSLTNATGKVTYEDICYVYGHTIEDDSDCTTALTCSECGEIFENAYEAHDVQAIIEYNNGFGSVGYKGVSCQRCAYKETTEVSPLFTVLGFSAAQYGDALFSVNYRVNEDAILAYEEITGEAVNYGVFAVKAETIGTNDIFDENGVARTGVVAADLTDAGFGLVNLKIMGFDEEQKDIDLAMGAFVKTSKDGTVKYSYLQIDEPTNGKYFFASYNDVLLITPKDEEESAQ